MTNDYIFEGKDISRQDLLNGCAGLTVDPCPVSASGIPVHDPALNDAEFSVPAGNIRRRDTKIRTAAGSTKSLTAVKGKVTGVAVRQKTEKDRDGVFIVLKFQGLFHSVPRITKSKIWTSWFLHTV